MKTPGQYNQPRCFSVAYLLLSNNKPNRIIAADSRVGLNQPRKNIFCILLSLLQKTVFDCSLLHCVFGFGVELHLIIHGDIIKPELFTQAHLVVP